MAPRPRLAASLVHRRRRALGLSSVRSEALPCHHSLPKNLGGRDENCGLAVYEDVPGQQPDPVVALGGAEVPLLLVTLRLDGRNRSDAAADARLKRVMRTETVRRSAGSPVLGHFSKQAVIEAILLGVDVIGQREMLKPRRSFCLTPCRQRRRTGDGCVAMQTVDEVRNGLRSRRAFPD